MNTKEERITILDALNRFYEDPEVQGRTYYPEFRRRWNTAFQKALAQDGNNLEHGTQSVLAVPHSYGDVEITFHFDQLKMIDWFQMELKHRQHNVFQAKKLKRSHAGQLTFHESVCHYDSNAPEPALTDDNRNIFACALPGIPPVLHVVYGNKWVDSRFHPLLRRSLQLYLIQTDYVPSFLGDDFEICVYLFLMDCCIIKENYTKVKDEELQKFLHILRPSPTLKFKDLAEAEC